MPGFHVAGTDAFRRAAADLRAAGRGDLTRKMTAGMRRAAAPVVTEMQDRVRGVSTRTVRAGRRLATTRTGRRGGASARQARAAHALRTRRRLTDRARITAHRRSGLRDTVARATGATASTSPTRAAVRIRAAQARMPADQRKLPRHLDKGRWRHPTFGRAPWVTQVVTPEWFSGPRRRHGPRVRTAAHAVVIDVLHRLAD
ncbi:hypothetical protein [Saccharothrix australiensis]|uniref:Uncharacterized protein n=1 Tax=Saccharothrix australiensis TaxID=2072 RepID=A0A495VIZ7_9PSEU|nr:hypothetical protein [Saccharothrix australiensis]RKT49361.1 hypothetical protein C8E97_6740 [Saccharothrix australiensis]